MIYDLQKASLLKRFSAFLLDFILICIVAVGFAALISRIAKFDVKYQQFDAYMVKYGEEYGVDMFKMLDAEFAIIIYDRKSGKFIAARDPL